jgi:hypothetical protein
MPRLPPHICHPLEATYNEDLVILYRLKFVRERSVAGVNIDAYLRKRQRNTIMVITALHSWLVKITTNFLCL